ncbi:MAG: histidine--tRNA ligase [Paludibacteraceae bacterium]|nr:histidine--tRNA ligase [Paludibacteraceae bacterium]
MNKPSIPKGTRDFGHEETSRRNYIFNTIQSVFRLYGFQQIETPAMEQMSTLMGKYGEEGDKLLFRIQNSGEKAGEMPEKGLRYDLTVPFARYIVMHRQELTFPFKRFQIQPVWRADRPQKGRYREFYQCDADVIGTQSLVSESELIEIVKEVYRRLGLRVVMKINNRKILAGIAEYIGAPDKMTDITVAIDKLDKTGLEKVNEELMERGLSAESVARLQPILALSGTNEEKLQTIENLTRESETGKKGVEEIRTVFGLYNTTTREADNDSFSVELDLTLARGLNYYTGAIFEVKAKDVQIGSITGGGRYDNLTGIFGLPDVSGVGISFGADRIYDCLSTLDLFPSESAVQTQLLFAAMGEDEMRRALSWANKLRNAGNRVEVYPDLAKMKKQLGYADANHIPYAAIIGSDEMTSQTVTLKNMVTGEQRAMSYDELATFIKKNE